MEPGRRTCCRAAAPGHGLALGALLLLLPPATRRQVASEQGSWRRLQGGDASEEVTTPPPAPVSLSSGAQALWRGVELALLATPHEKQTQALAGEHGHESHHHSREHEREGHEKHLHRESLAKGGDERPGIEELHITVHAPAVHGGEAHASSEGDHAHDVDAAHSQEVGLSFTLIAIIMILLILLFFVNSKDADIVAYTWDVLCKGINVFVAVTIFLAFEQPFSKGSEENAWWQVTIFMGLGLVLAVWLLLKAATAESNPEQKTVLIRTLGSLVAHLAAFMMINFWSNIQCFIARERLLLGGGPLSVGLVVPVAGAVHWGFMVLVRFARVRYVSWDGVVDESERLWLEKIQEVDMEAGALEMAFLAMQAIRFAVLGAMPDVWGGIHGDVPGWGQNGWFCFVAAFACAISMVLRMHIEEDEAVSSRSNYKGHCLGLNDLIVLFTNLNSFLCGWALLYAFQGIFEASDPMPDGHTDIMLVRTAVALMSSGWAFIIISFLDSINDRLYHSELVHREAEGVIASVGMMVGFAWERCFHHAFEVAADGVAEIVQKMFKLELAPEAEVIPEVTIFMLGCAAMSFVTTVVALRYITPRSIEATQKAKLEKSCRHRVLLQADRDDSCQDPSCSTES